LMFRILNCRRQVVGQDTGSYFDLQLRRPSTEDACQLLQHQARCCLHGAAIVSVAVAYGQQLSAQSQSINTPLIQIRKGYTPSTMRSTTLATRSALVPNKTLVASLVASVVALVFLNQTALSNIPIILIQNCNVLASQLPPSIVLSRVGHPLQRIIRAPRCPLPCLLREGDALAAKTGF
jgi:hypothetical protein